MAHIVPALFSRDSAGMAFPDYIVVFALHIQHRPMRYASFSSFLTLLPFHLNVSWSYGVGREEVVREGADRDSRMYEVDMGCGYDSS